MPEIRRIISQIWKPGMRVRLVGVAVSHFEKDEVVQESLFDTAPFDASSQDEQGAAKKPSIDAEVGRSLSKADPIKLKTALVKARSFSAVTCDLKTRQQELQRKTPPITLDSMHSALRCAALPQGTCFRCRPNQGLSVKHHYGSFLPHRPAFGRKKRPQWGRILH